MDSSAAVIDGGLDSFSPLRLWNEAMKKYGVMQDCDRAMEAATAAKTTDETARIEHDRTVAIAAAVHALARMNNAEIRHP